MSMSWSGLPATPHTPILLHKYRGHFEDAGTPTALQTAVILTG
jgi:hypothetical protein